MSLTLKSNPVGTMHIGKIVAEFVITPDGNLVFPAGSTSRAMAIVEAIDHQINQTAPITVKALPAPTEAAAAKEVEVDRPRPKPAKDGTRRGRPPKR